MRADGEGSSLADEDAGTGTGGSEPVTTGLTGLSAGGTQSSGGTTTSQPAPDADAAGDDSGTSQDGASSTSGGGGLEDTEGTDGSDGESGSSTTAVEPPADALDLSGWRVVQTSSERTFTLPAGTVLPAGAVLVLGRDSSRGAFEQHWGALAEDALYVDTEDRFPAINGDETFSLLDPADTLIDGPTPAMASGGAMTRTDVSAAGSWTSAGEGTATPGVGHEFSGSAGVFITEVSDASGTGAYVYEFIELQAWP